MTDDTIPSLEGPQSVMDAVSNTHDTFTCHFHGTVVDITPDTEGCPDCNAFLDNPPDPMMMTGAERRAELEAMWNGILTVKFERMHQRIEALVGRPVWTHEMGTSGWVTLLAEAESWAHPDDLHRHAIDTAADLVGAEKVFVFPEAPQHD